MVVLSEPVCCVRCASAQVIRFGRTENGNQRYRCRACGKSFCLHPGTTAYPPEFKEQLERACDPCKHGRYAACVVSLASAATRLSSGWGNLQTLPLLDETLLAPQKGDSLEADEMWNFVASKKNQI